MHATAFLHAFRRSALLAAPFLLLAASSAAPQSVRDYVIGAQDLLAITVFDQADLGGRYTVEQDGSFTFPLIGRIQAGGLTIRELEAALAGRLADGFFRNPQVTVAIDQYRSQRVFVIGEVRSAGTYPLTGDTTLIEAIAHAGSTTPSASDQVIIVRGGSDAREAAAPEAVDSKERIQVNLRDLQSGSGTAQNITLRDGDTIYVARAEMVYVFGEVRNPGSYPIRSDTTVLQALSLAGGVAPSGAVNRTRIVRIVDGEQREIRVDLNDLVRPEDTIIVPERFF